MVTQTLVGLSVLAFALQLAPGLSVTERFAFAPALAQSQPWRLVTSAFLHQTNFLPHILFNMYLLWVVGPQLELRFGRSRFLALYLLSAAGGSVGYLVLADPTDPRSWHSAVVGASGAVFGLFGALLLVNRRLGLDSRAVLVFFAINAAIGFFPGAQIAWQAHLGGLATGALVGLVLAYAPRARRVMAQTAGLTGVLVLLVALTAMKLATS